MTPAGNYKSIRLSDIINEQQAKSLKVYVAKGRAERYLTPSVHGLVMKWLDLNPIVKQQMEKNEVLPEYGAYLLEYYLQLK